MAKKDVYSIIGTESRDWFDPSKVILKILRKTKKEETAEEDASLLAKIFTSFIPEATTRKFLKKLLTLAPRLQTSLPKMMKIIVARDSHHASLEGISNWTFGRTTAEAIGYLVMGHCEQLKIDIETEKPK